MLDGGWWLSEDEETNAAYNSESGWAEKLCYYCGSGGGVSPVVDDADYQAGPGVVNGGSSGLTPVIPRKWQNCREVPVIAPIADLTRAISLCIARWSRPVVTLPIPM